MNAALLALAAHTPELPGAVCVDPVVREVFDRAS